MINQFPDFLGDDFYNLAMAKEHVVVPPSKANEIAYALPFRPISVFMFWAELKMFGANPWNFKLVSLGMQLLLAILVYALAKNVFIHLTGGEQIPFQVACAIVFAVHADLVHSIIWISQQNELLMTLFYVGALICAFKFVSSGSWIQYLLSASSFMLSTLCKEQSLHFPLIVLLWYHLLKSRKISVVPTNKLALFLVPLSVLAIANIVVRIILDPAATVSLIWLGKKPIGIAASLLFFFYPPVAQTMQSFFWEHVGLAYLVFGFS
jgi:hypothetical protein